jgi:hypothetical protein
VLFADIAPEPSETAGPVVAVVVVAIALVVGVLFLVRYARGRRKD